jgi:hypothetical protein
VLAALFLYESIREKEPRAPKIGWALLAALVLLALLTVFIPSIRSTVAVFFGLVLLFGLLFLIPAKTSASILTGSMGHVVGEVKRFDERDISFASDVRNALRPVRLALLLLVIKPFSMVLKSGNWMKTAVLSTGERQEPIVPYAWVFALFLGQTDLSIVLSGGCWSILHSHVGFFLILTI